MQCDLLIRNGKILDGRAEGFSGDVLVKEGRIAAVERKPGQHDAQQVIDAAEYAHFVAHRADDVVGAQQAEEIGE